MFNMFFVLFKGIFTLLKYPLYLFLGTLIVFILFCCVFICIELSKGRRFKKGFHNILKKENFFKRIFIQLPRQFVDDIFNRDPEFFKYQGLIIFEGRQGAGKSIGMVEYALRMIKEYPKSKLTTNMDLKYQNEALSDWRMLMSYKNGIRGVVVVMDELQNWFSSNDSKNFPPEMLSIITQNRKNRRIILGTSQNFYLLAKAIRSQATEVRRCATFLGAVTIVRRYEPLLDSEGNVVKFKFLGMYFFVHNKELRNCYDTYKVIDRLKNVGFKENVNTDIIQNTKFYITKEGIKKIK